MTTVDDVERLADDDPAVVDLLHLCAALAPEPVPLHWVAADVADRLGAHARIDDGGILLDPSTREILRGRRTAMQQRQDIRLARQLLGTVPPDDDADPANWPAWRELVPHLLYLDPAGFIEAEQRDLAFNAVWFLLRSGRGQDALDLAEACHRGWLATDGPDDPHVMIMTSTLASAHRSLGHEDEARQLHQRMYERFRQQLGEDHPNTLTAAHNLAAGLRGAGEDAAALDLDRDTLARRRRVLGEDDPDTLTSAMSLASDLFQAGEYAAARDLDQDTVDRYRRVLGEDHPDTLNAATNLAIDLRQAGEYAAAHDLDRDILERSRRVLGDDHPDTVTVADYLAEDLRLINRSSGNSSDVDG